MLVALGPDRLEGVIQELLPQASHELGYVREGAMWLLAFLPPTMGAHFADLIPRALPVIIRGLSDTTDSVREVSMRAGQIIVTHHALSHHSLLLPRRCGPRHHYGSGAAERV